MVLHAPCSIRSACEPCGNGIAGKRMNVTTSDPVIDATYQGLHSLYPFPLLWFGVEANDIKLHCRSLPSLSPAKLSACPVSNNRQHSSKVTNGGLPSFEPMEQSPQSQVSRNRCHLDHENGPLPVEPTKEMTSNISRAFVSA